jgi:glycolate oxidase iron-sulfur subunit
MEADKLLEETGRCVACGLCLPHCPTYHKTQSEADSPRGRILLTQAVLQGAIPANARYQAHMDLCLTCRACERACPNQVPYGKIAEGARAMLRQQRPATLPEKLGQTLVSGHLMLRIAGGLLRLTTLLHLQKLFPRLPATPPQQRWNSIYPAPSPRGEVYLFTGCFSSILESDTLAASIVVLNRLGYTVHAPKAQTCCGGLHAQAGDSPAALEQRNRDAFPENFPIVSVASGCGMRLADTFAKRAQDINMFLAKAEGWENIQLNPLQASIAVHEPCSLRNGLKGEASLYSLLKRIPQATVTPLPGNAQCCGGAGSYMLTQPEMANRLLDDKVALTRKAAPDIIATANIGCALQLAKGLASEKIRIVHPVLLITEQMGFQR